MTTRRASAATTLLAFVLCSCGGGGGDTAVGSPTSTATVPAVPGVAPQFRDHGWFGAYGATVSGSPTRQIILATSPEWGLLAVYGENAGSDFKPLGQLWDLGPPIHVVDPERTDVSGELSIDSGSGAVSGTLSWGTDQRAVSGGGWFTPGYRPDQPATLASVIGHWDLTTSRGRQISMDVHANGDIFGLSGPCSIYGSRITPTKTGSGLFAITLRFQSGAWGCPEPHGMSDGVYGFAAVYPSTDGRAQLVVGAANGWDPVFLSAAGKR